MLYEGAQAVFGALSGSGQDASGNTTSSPEAAFTKALPTDLGSLITFVLTLGALRDWLKIFLLGGLLESARRFVYYLYGAVFESFLLTVEIDGDDPAHAWMLLWLSKHERWSKARTVELSSRRHNHRGDSDLPPGKEINLAPTMGSTHTLFYKRRLIRVTRTKQQLGDGVVEKTLVINIYSRSHSIIDKLIDEAKKQYIAEVDSRICIYVSDQYQNFYMAGSRPKRDMDSVIIPPKMKQFLMSDAEDFLGSEGWYSQRGIPWQRGYLLYGVPGAGKTSIIQALAGHFGLNIYVISLARRGLDDSSLVDMINGIPPKSIILMEDIDAAFTHSATRETSGEDAAAAANPASSLAMSASSITLSGLLNAIDGVQAQPGRLLFATTNKYDALDPALIRPGRLDVHLEFRRASRWQAEQLFNKFYPVGGHYVDGDDEDVSAGVDGTAGDVDEDEIFTVTGSSSSTRVSTPTHGFSSLPSLTSGSGEKGAALSSQPIDIPALAKLFASFVKPDTVSMAALQGHLMMYKTKPALAARSAEAFMQKVIERNKAKVPAPAATAASVPAPTTDTTSPQPPAPAVQDAAVPEVTTPTTI